MNTRKEICSLICTLSPQCSSDEIESTLGSFLKLGKDINSVANNPQDETPLMIACDKGKLNILKYFASIYSNASPETKLVYTRSLGDCLYPLENDANNQAVHYASIEHIPYLTTILYEQKRKDFCSEYDAFKALICQKNSHGDTFVMVLCASGDSEGVEKLLTIHSDMQQKCDAVDDDLSNIFNMINASGDSAITLTYMSGHFKLLRFLLSRLLKLDISHKDVVRLQNALDKTVSIEKIIPAHNMDLFKSKQSNIKQCLELITSHLQKLSDRVARDLLEKEELMKNTQQVNLPEKKNPTKPRKKSLEYSKATFHSLIDRTNVLVEDKAKNIISTPRFITLEDGTVVSERSRLEKVGEGTPILSILQQESRIEKLLMERCLPSLGDANHEEIISMMESLCIDPSMLLLSPQSMAMKLSPSQLEAVEAILKKQLVAISHAREIHSRLMNIGDQK
jgi:ankyrin repeat protein